MSTRIDSKFDQTEVNLLYEVTRDQLIIGSIGFFWEMDNGAKVPALLHQQFDYFC